MPRRERRSPLPAPRRRIPPELAVLAVALLVRAIHAWQFGASPLGPVLIGDGAGYDAWARRILSAGWLGRGEGVFYQAPLYPYFLAVVYALGGAGAAAVRGVQAVLGAVACALVARAGRTWISPQAGAIAGFMLALYPPAVYFDGLIQKSTLDLFLLAVALWLAARADTAEEPRTAAAALLALGAALGALALSRENGLVFVGAVAAWLLVRARPLPLRRAAAGALVAAGLAGALVPVVARNLVIGGEAHLTTSQLGPNFFIGNHAGASGLYEPLRADRGNQQLERRDATELAEQATGRRLSPGEVSRFWLGRSLLFVRERPLEWLRLIGKKALLTFNAVEVADTEDVYGAAAHAPLLRALMSVWGFGPLLALAAAGAAATWHSRRSLVLVHASIVLYATSVAAFYVFARYRYPLVPFLALLAGAGAHRLWEAVRARDARRAAPWLLAGAAGAVVAALPLVDVSMQRALTPLNVANDLARRQGRLVEAIPHFAEALRLNPEFAAAHLGLANCLRGAGRRAEAVEHYRAALRTGPGLDAAEYSLGSLLLELGRAAEAAGHARRAIALEPGRWQYHQLLGEALAAAGGDAGPALAEARRLRDGAL